MTAQPTRDQLSKRAGHILFTQGPERPAATAREVCVLLDLLAAAEHRATRAEAQSDIRGRAVVIYRERARQAEAERDRWHSMWRQRGIKHLAAKKRATRAEAERDDWREVALQERGAALDALEQIKARDKRIQAVEDVLDRAREEFEQPDEAAIRRALESMTTPQ